MAATASANSEFVKKVYEYLCEEANAKQGWQSSRAQLLPGVTSALTQGCLATGPHCSRKNTMLLHKVSAPTPLSPVGLAVLFGDADLFSRLTNGGADFDKFASDEVRSACALDAAEVFNDALRAVPAQLAPGQVLYKLQKDSAARSAMRAAISEQMQRAGQSPPELAPEPVDAAAAAAAASAAAVAAAAQCAPPPTGSAGAKAAPPPPAAETRIEKLLRFAGAAPSRYVEVYELLCPKNGSGVQPMDANVAHADGRLALLEAIKAVEHDANAVRVVKLLVDGPMAKTLVKDNRAKPIAFASADVPADCGVGSVGWERHALFLALERASDPGGPEVLRFLLSRGAAMRWTDAVFDKAIARASYLLGEGRGSVNAKYWLEVGKNYRPYNPSPEQLKLWADADLGRLQAMPFSLVGQSGAKITCATKLINWASATQFAYKRPLVMCLAGPPGHGKSEMFQVLVDVLQLSDDPKQAVQEKTPEAGAHFVSMGQINSSNDFTTLGSAYQSKPTPMEDWLAAHDGKRGLLVFDEMDKLMDKGEAVTGILGGMLPLMEDGVFTITVLDAEGKSVRKPVNTRKLVILLTTNWGQAQILEWFKVRMEAARAKNVVEGAFRFATIDHAMWLKHSLGAKVQEEVRGVLMTKGKDAMVSRVDAWVPFIPFTPSEANCVVESLLQNLAVVLAMPRDTKGEGPVERMQHKLKLTWDFEVVEASLRGPSTLCPAFCSPFDGGMPLVATKTHPPPPPPPSLAFPRTQCRRWR